jgi:Holliday junction DNA helicase RuvA
VIASLSGQLSSKGPNSVVVDVGGVGYLVNVVPQLSASKAVGDPISLQTRLVVREDSMTLFGFETAEEIELFDLVTSVNGIGPKLGLSILASLTAEAIRNAVASESDATFRSVPGIGPKTAKLIVVTLAGKLAPSATGSASSSEVVTALVGLGYSEKQAAAAVASVGASANSADTLRKALAELSNIRNA